MSTPAPALPPAHPPGGTGPRPMPYSIARTLILDTTGDDDVGEIICLITETSPRNRALASHTTGAYL